MGLLGACQAEIPVVSERPSNKLYIEVEALLPSTKTVLSDSGSESSFIFNQSDSIGFYAGSILTNVGLGCNASETGKFNGVIELEPEQVITHTPVMFYAYYPYNHKKNNGPSTINGFLSSRQAAPFDGSADYLIANSIPGVFDVNSFPHLSFAFDSHLFAIVKLSVKNTSEELSGEQILDIGLKSTGSELAGAFSFDATNPENDAIFSSEIEELSQRVKVAYDEMEAPTLGKNATHTVYAVIKPGEFNAGELRLLVTTTHYSFSLATKVDVAIPRNQVTVFPEVDLADPDEKGVVKKSNTMDILSFSLSADGKKYYDAFEITDGLISVQVPNGTDMSHMTVKFTHNGQGVTVDGIEQTSEVSKQDYSDFVNPVHFVVAGAEDESRDYTIRMFDLPIVYLNTPSPINSKDIWTPDCSFSIQEADGTITDYGNAVEVKGRGNSTWRQEKKPYTIKLKSKAKVFGLPADKRWNLLANALDRTIIRNSVALEIAHRADKLGWASHGTFVELFMNGEYRGNYFICEHNKISSNRINIAEMSIGDTSEETISGGYLLEFDTTNEHPYFITETCEYPVQIKSPDDDGFELQWGWIENYINEVERTLADEESLMAHKYLKYIDLDSFIDWWLTYEVIMNTEPYYGPRSAFMHKDRGGKLKAGPAWDFDRCFRSGLGPNGFKLKDALYYKYLFKDPYFRSKIKERWPAFKANLEGMSDYIDLQIETVSHSAERNGEMWPITLNINTDESLPVSVASAQIKTEYEARIRQLDKLINALDATPVNSNSENENYGDQTNPDFGFGF